MKFTRVLILFIILLFTFGCDTKEAPTKDITITFLSNGGEKIDPIITKANTTVTLPTPSRTGFDFVTWKDTVGTIYKDEVSFFEDTTLVANWVIKNFTVTFVDSDDTLISTQTVEYNKSATSPEYPTKEGLSFNSWDKSFTNVTSNLTVKAVYETSTTGLIFDLIGEEYFVIGYTGSSLDVVIPSKYNGLSVTTIAKEAFKLSTIKSVVIPNSILYIEEFAFMDASNLEELNIPTSVLEIGESAFENNVSLHKVFIGAKKIGAAAFYSSNRLTSITISNNTEEIGTAAFYNCSDLVTLEIPKSVNKIGDNFVSWCQKLTTIYTPSDNIATLQSIIDSVSLIYVKSLNKTVMPIN